MEAIATGKASPHLSQVAVMAKKKNTPPKGNKNWKVMPGDTPPEKLVELAKAEVAKAKKKAATKKSGSDKDVPTKLQCDVKGCDYEGGSKSVVTRHWNKVHRKPHAQKRNARKANQDQGWPTVLTPQVVAKLVTAFQNGLSKKQAIRYAGISKDAYYDGVKKDKDFADKMSEAQWRPNMRAREVIVQAINNGDTKSAQWWLERKEKNEFTLRRETTGAGGGAVKVEASRPKSLSLEELHDAVLGDT